MRAEETMKLAERIERRVIEASVQELRYAGRREVQAHLLRLAAAGQELTPEQYDEWLTHAIEACENCVKARDDALDSAVTFMADEVEQAVNKIGLNKVLAEFSDLSEFRRNIRECDRLMTESRGDRLKLDDNYSKIENEHLPAAIQRYHQFKDNVAVAIALRTIQEAEEEAARIEYGKQQFRAGLKKLLGLTALLYAIGIGIVSSIAGNILTRYFPPPTH
jgi:hypothetical protein